MLDQIGQIGQIEALNQQINQQLEASKGLVGLAVMAAQVYLRQSAVKRFLSMSPKRRKAVLRGQHPELHVSGDVDGRLTFLRAHKAARRARRESLAGKRLAGRMARRARRQGQAGA